MKKTIILTSNENTLQEEELRDFVEFADKNDMEIIGVAHYPFLTAINHPKEFVHRLSRQTEVNTYNIVNIIFTKNVNLKITRNVNLLLPVLLTYVYLFRPFLVFQHIHKILGSI